MDRTASDYVALGVYLLTVACALVTHHAAVEFALLGGVALALVWYAEQIDEATFGAWLDYHRIDVHTPPVLIAAMGWLGLGVCALSAVYPGWVHAWFEPP